MWCAISRLRRHGLSAPAIAVGEERVQFTGISKRDVGRSTSSPFGKGVSGAIEQRSSGAATIAPRREDCCWCR